MATLRMTTARSAVARPTVAARPVVAVRRVAMRSTPDKAAVETAIKEAEQACAGGNSGECAAAWDNVEEISAAISHKKAVEVTDPLEQFCDDNPDADECRVYDE